MNNNGKKIVSGTIIYAIGNLGTHIIAFLIVPLYTFYIATEDMGDYDIINSTISLMAPIITLRISDAAYRWLLHKSDKNENCISATYLVIFLGTAIASIIVLAINFFIPIKYCYYIIATLVCGRWLESLQPLLRGLKRQFLFAISGIVYTGIYVSINFVLIVIMHRGVESIFQGVIASQIITSILIIICTPEFRKNISIFKVDKKLLKDLLKYSIPLVPSGLSWWIMGLSDRYVVLFFLGRSANGIYSVANKFPSILSMLFIIFNYAWTDVAISNLKAGKETSEYSSSLFRMLYKLAFSFLMFLIPITKIVSHYILGANYQSADIYVGFLYLGAAFQGFTTFISAGMLQGTNTKSIASSSIIGALFNLIVDLCLIKFIGLHAASISTFVGFFVMWLIRMHDTKKTTPISINLKEFSFLLIISVIVAAVSMFSNIFVDIFVTIFALVFMLLYNKNTIIQMLNKLTKSKPGEK